MEQNYLDQIQNYLNNYNITNDSNENISLNKNQLLECFQMLLNSKEQQNIKSNTNINTSQKNKEEEKISQSNINKTQDSSTKKLNNISPKQDINNLDEMPLPTLKNKEKNNTNNFPSGNNNIADIPIKGGSNFNELLEKELSKENDNYDNFNHENVEPRFKYIPKKRNDIISVPTKTKKYKYYSDNFKSKKKKERKRI